MSRSSFKNIVYILTLLCLPFSLLANALACGQYFGISYNYAWHKVEADISPNGTSPSNLLNSNAIPASITWRPNGSAGGIQIGFNRLNQDFLVWGGEIDYQQADISGSTTNIVQSGTTEYFFEGYGKLDFFSTVRLKFGTMATKDTFVGITGGYVVGRLHQKSTFTQSDSGTFTRSWALDHKSTESGWCLGLTSEHLFSKHFSFGLLYLFYQFASNNVSAAGTVPGADGTFDYSFENQGQLIRLNLNYYF